MPSIDIRCPHCNQKLGIDSKKFYANLGKKTKCPKCNLSMSLSQDLFVNNASPQQVTVRQEGAGRQPKKDGQGERYREEHAVDPTQGTSLKETAVIILKVLGGALVAVIVFNILPSKSEQVEHSEPLKAQVTQQYSAPVQVSKPPQKDKEDRDYISLETPEAKLKKALEDSIYGPMKPKVGSSYVPAPAVRSPAAIDKNYRRVAGKSLKVPNVKIGPIKFGMSKEELSEVFIGIETFLYDPWEYKGLLSEEDYKKANVPQWVKRSRSSLPEYDSYDDSLLERNGVGDSREQGILKFISQGGPKGMKGVDYVVLDYLPGCGVIEILVVYNSEISQKAIMSVYDKRYERVSYLVTGKTNLTDMAKEIINEALVHQDMNCWRAGDGILINQGAGGIHRSGQRITATWYKAMDTYKMEVSARRKKEEALRAEAEGKSLGL